MASSLLPDPLKLWRDAVTKLETEINSVAAGRMKSREIVRALQQFSSITTGIEQVFEKVLDGYLRKVHLPSRKEVTALAESLRRIEDKLDRLLPPDTAAVPRPARTRRAQGAASAQAAATAPEPAAKRTRRGVRRKEG